MACVPACPSGVHYDRLIEAARGWSEEPPGRRGPRPAAAPLGARRAARAAIFATFPYPRRLRLLARPLRAAQRTGVIGRIEPSGLAARFAPELVASLRVAPSPPAAAGTGPMARRVPAQGPRRAVVGLLTGCVQQVFFPGVNEATVRVLAAEGCDVVIPRAGLLRRPVAAQRPGRGGRRVRPADDHRVRGAGVDVVVVNSAGCGSAMKEYPHLFPAGGPGAAGPGGSGPDAAQWARRAARFTGGVRDFSEFLAELAADGGPRAVRHPLPGHRRLSRGLPPGARAGHPAPAP